MNLTNLTLEKLPDIFINLLRGLQGQAVEYRIQVSHHRYCLVQGFLVYLGCTNYFLLELGSKVGLPFSSRMLMFNADDVSSPYLHEDQIKRSHQEHFLTLSTRKFKGG
jgi:hypothetical protein